MSLSTSLSSSTPIITIFGGGGFIGRYTCEALFRRGARVRNAERDPRRAFALQPLAEVGQLAMVQADLTRPATLARAIEGASAVINLVGAFDGDLDAIHVGGARSIAEAATAAGVEALVHVSAIGADPAATSRYGRTKGEGEAAIRSGFPTATILRPSVVFGPEDQFTNRFASMSRLPMLPVIAPRTRFQPVFVGDVGRAIATAALDPKAHGGKTFDLAGPEILSMVELNRRIADLAGQSPAIVEVPDFIGSAMAALGFLPGAPLSKDQWLMLQHDNVAAPAAPGLAALGIEPTPLGAVAPEWLGRFHKGGRFAPKATA